MAARRDEFDVTRAGIAATVRVQSADTSPVDPPRRSRAVLAFDGKLQFCNAAMKLLADDSTRPFKGPEIKGLKIPASASKFPSRRNAATWLKKLNRTRKHVTRADYGGLLGPSRPCIPKASSSATHHRPDFLERLPALLSSAYNQSSLIKGWEIIALYPSTRPQSGGVVIHGANSPRCRPTSSSPRSHLRR